MRYVTTLRDIYRKGGLFSSNGLYKGYWLTVPCQTLNIALSFSVFYTLKSFEQLKFSSYFGDLISTLFCGTVTGVIASGVTHPLDLMRRRQQVNEKPESFLQMCKNIYRKDNIRGFYRGFTPELMKVVPTVSLTFYLYKHLNTRLEGRYGCVNKR